VKALGQLKQPLSQPNIRKLPAIAPDSTTMKHSNT
jgi:hypothetical protein